MGILKPTQHPLSFMADIVADIERLFLVWPPSDSPDLCPWNTVVATETALKDIKIMMGLSWKYHGI